jgi:nicotinamidase/pyrazinamidase
MPAKSLRLRPGKDVLIDVDLQPAFMPGGGLPVADGQKILPIVKMLHRRFGRRASFLTLDRHPRGHVSLASSYVGLAPYATLDAAAIRDWTEEFHGVSGSAKFTFAALKDYLGAVGSQTLWPDHAIVGSGEDVLHRDLDPLDYCWAQIKGTDPLCDSYSGFRDNLRRPTGLAGEIRRRVPGAERVFLTGLAYDFCVGWTALDAVEEGFEAVVIRDATRPVALPGTIEAIEAKFAAKRVRVVSSSDLRS